MISIEALDHFYGEGELRHQILHGVSLDIFPGEITILTGPSGSGKTTLLTLCGALRSVQAGSVRILGQQLLGAANRTQERIRNQVGVIFQAHNLIEALTARQNVALALGLDKKLTKAERYQRAAEMLQAVGLGQRLDHYPDQLSGGQKQRVAIARALVRSPRIILADEPTASLDRKSGREVIELVSNLSKSTGCAVLLVTHDNRILDIADRIVTLDDGRLVSFASALAANTGNILQGFTRLQRSGELLGHVEALSTKQFVELLDHLTSEFRQYLQVFEIGSREAVQALFDSVLKATTLKMIGIMQADRGTLYFVDRAAGLLRSRIATGEGDTMISIQAPIAASIAGQVVVTGQTLNIADAYQSAFFNPDFDRATGYRTGSMLCMPIIKTTGEIFAVAQLLNRKGPSPFSAADEEQFNEFADSLGVILENCVELQNQLLSEHPGALEQDPSAG